MAQTVTVAGKKLPKSYVIAGGALTAGIVGYAWWQNARQSGAPTVVDPTPNLPEPTDEPGFGISGGEEPPKTNAEWTRRATELMRNIGYDAGAVASAIGKFLARTPLNKSEVDLVRASIGQAGYPPENGPWTVIEETPGAVTPSLTKAPTGFRYLGPQSKDHHRLVWDPVPGATGYVIQYTGPGGVGSEWPESGPEHIAYLAAGPAYTYDVWAVNSAGASPKARLTWQSR